eukprot:1522215-Alexandrium_andersonii.AAC.1
MHTERAPRDHISAADKYTGSANCDRGLTYHDPTLPWSAQIVIDTPVIEASRITTPHSRGCDGPLTWRLPFSSRGGCAVHTAAAPAGRSGPHPFSSRG